MTVADEYHCLSQQYEQLNLICINNLQDYEKKDFFYNTSASSS